MIGTCTEFTRKGFTVWWHSAAISALYHIVSDLSLNADDTQLYLRCDPGDIANSVHFLADSVVSVKKWRHCLKLNPTH